MDILLEIVKLEKNQLEDYKKALKKSNLPTDLAWDIIALLEAAHRQTLQAEDMGWL